eukprot:TRINITY_DN59192_c0_g1_i1.p1 TRINITY_DN59192_c0_g1~~TRINITY_DN59192_c0_g1_i1.p1  ORF type:complete len:151 (-),score=4.91 TRINITY_DN59192_c0_g1_i1:176-628(-)
MRGIFLGAMLVMLACMGSECFRKLSPAPFLESTASRRGAQNIGPLRGFLDIPGVNRVLNRRFLYSSSLSEPSLQDKIRLEVDYLDRRLAGARRLMSFGVLILSIARIYAVYRMLLSGKSYFLRQQRELEEEERRLYGTFTSPDATRKADN